MRPFFGLSQVIPGSSDNDFFPVKDEQLKQFLQAAKLRPIIHHGQKVDPEADLHLGHFIKLIDDDFGYLVSFQSDGDPHPVSIRFVPNVLHPLNLSVFNEERDFLDASGFVDLVR